MHKLVLIPCTSTARRALTLSLAFFGAGLAWSAEPSRPTAPVVILDFAMTGAEARSGDELASRACIASPGSPQATSEDAKNLADAVGAGLPSIVVDALSQQLTSRGSRSVYRDLGTAPADALVIAGCIVRADPGDPAKRLVGMNLGASKLAARVRIYRSGPQPVLLDEFDTEVEGVNKAPPLGPIGLLVHGVKERHQTLPADAEKVAWLPMIVSMTSVFGRPTPVVRRSPGNT